MSAEHLEGSGSLSNHELRHQFLEAQENGRSTTFLAAEMARRGIHSHAYTKLPDDSERLTGLDMPVYDAVDDGTPQAPEHEDSRWISRGRE